MATKHTPAAFNYSFEQVQRYGPFRWRVYNKRTAEIVARGEAQNRDEMHKDISAAVNKSEPSK